MSTNKKSNDAEDILSEFDFRSKPTSESIPEPTSESIPEPTSESIPEPTSESIPEPTSESIPEPTSESIPEPTSESSPIPEPTNTAEENHDVHISEERNVIFIGTKPIMNYVSATLTQLSTRPSVTIKARGKRITQAVDVSQMIVKRMSTVGYVISDVRISSDSLTSEDGKLRNVSNMEIDLSKE